MFEDQLDGCFEALVALSQSVALAVGAVDLRRPGDEPAAVALDDRREFTAHGLSIDRAGIQRAQDRIEIRP